MLTHANGKPIRYFSKYPGSRLLSLLLQSVPSTSKTLLQHVKMYFSPKLLVFLAVCPAVSLALPANFPREAEAAPAPGYGNYGKCKSKHGKFSLSQSFLEDAMRLSLVYASRLKS